MTQGWGFSSWLLQQNCVKNCWLIIFLRWVNLATSTNVGAPVRLFSLLLFVASSFAVLYFWTCLGDEVLRLSLIVLYFICLLRFIIWYDRCLKYIQEHSLKEVYVLSIIIRSLISEMLNLNLRFSHSFIIYGGVSPLDCCNRIVLNEIRRFTVVIVTYFRCHIHKPLNVSHLEAIRWPISRLNFFTSRFALGNWWTNHCVLASRSALCNW